VGVSGVIAALTFGALLSACAPAVGPRTMAALVAHESGARPFAIADDTTRRSYDPATRASAIALAAALLRQGHDIDAGYAQINSANFAATGLTAARVFDPCANLAAGARILALAYASAARRYGTGQTALAHALSLYHSGSMTSGLDYAHAVFATAQRIGVRPKAPR